MSCTTHHYACDCREFLLASSIQEEKDKVKALELQLRESEKAHRETSELWLKEEREHEATKRLNYASAAAHLRAEAKKIPLGEGNVQKGFSSTYNALVFAAQVLEDHIEKQSEKRKCGIPGCPKPDHGEKYCHGCGQEPCGSGH